MPTAYCPPAAAQAAASANFRVTTQAVPESGGSPTTADARALVGPTVRTLLTMGRIGDAPKTTASFRIHEGYVPTLKFPPPAASAILSADGIPTSPGFVEVRVPADAVGVTVTPDGGTPATMTRLSPLRAFGFIPLSSVGGATSPDPTGYTVRDGVGGPIVSGSLTWAATDLAGKNAATDGLRIRLGDSLLLTASGGGGTLEIDGDGDGAFEHVGTPGQRFTHAYPAPGVFTARAKIDGVEVGSFRVTAVAVDLHGPIASEVNFRREKDVTVTPAGEASSVNFGADDFSGMFVGIDAVTATGAALALEPRARGTPVLVARLNGPMGLVLAYQEVDEFTLDLPARNDVLIDDDTNVGTSILTIHPIISNLRYEFNMFASRSTFSGGVTTFSVNSSQFVPRFDPETGETVGDFLYDLEVPDGEESYCFALRGFQASSEEKPIDKEKNANGRVCMAKVHPLTLCVCGPSAPLRLQLTSRANVDVMHSVDIVGDATIVPLFTLPDNRPDAPIWASFFNCNKAPGIQEAKNVRAQSVLGKFSVRIGFTIFVDKITVDPFTVRFTNVAGTRGNVAFPLTLIARAFCGGTDISDQSDVTWAWNGAPPGVVPARNTLDIPTRPGPRVYQITASATCNGLTRTTKIYVLTVFQDPASNPIGGDDDTSIDDPPCSDPPAPDQGLATAIPATIDLCVSTDQTAPLQSTTVTIAHSIVTTNTPRARDLKGNLFLDILSNDAAAVDVNRINAQGGEAPYAFGTAIPIVEPGHDGCGVHTWHTGSEVFRVTAKKPAVVVLEATVVPDPLDDGGPGSPTQTAQITIYCTRVDFQADPGQAYGFDEYDGATPQHPPAYDFISIKQGATTTCKVQIDPTDLPARVNFISGNDADVATANNVVLGGGLHTITLTGRAFQPFEDLRRSCLIQARLGSPAGPVCSILGAQVYQENRIPIVTYYRVFDSTSPLPTLPEGSNPTGPELLNFISNVWKQGVLGLDRLT